MSKKKGERSSPLYFGNVGLFQKTVVFTIHQHLLTKAVHIGHLNVHNFTLIIFNRDQNRIHETVVGGDIQLIGTLQYFFMNCSIDLFTVSIRQCFGSFVVSLGSDNRFYPLF